MVVPSALHARPFEPQRRRSSPPPSRPQQRGRERRSARVSAKPPVVRVPTQNAPSGFDLPVVEARIGAPVGFDRGNLLEVFQCRDQTDQRCGAAQPRAAPFARSPGGNLPPIKTSSAAPAAFRDGSNGRATNDIGIEKRVPPIVIDGCFTEFAAHVIDRIKLHHPPVSLCPGSPQSSSPTNFDARPPT